MSSKPPQPVEPIPVSPSGQQIQVPCERCDGTGKQEVTREMAIDAGNLNMQGDSISCGLCGGDGFTVELPADPSLQVSPELKLLRVIQKFLYGYQLSEPLGGYRAWNEGISSACAQLFDPQENGEVLKALDEYRESRVTAPIGQPYERMSIEDQLTSPDAERRRQEPHYGLLVKLDQFLHKLMEAGEFKDEAGNLHGEVHEAAFQYVTKTEPITALASPPQIAQRWTDQDLYDAYLLGCEDECRPEPKTKERFMEVWNGELPNLLPTM